MSARTMATYTRGPCGHIWFMGVESAETMREIAKAQVQALKAKGSVHRASVERVRKMKKPVCECKP